MPIHPKITWAKLAAMAEGAAARVATPLVTVEFFSVPPGEDAAFLAAWDAEPSGTTLFRALRDDVPLRYLSLDDPPAGGVVLVARAAGWDEAVFAGKQGFLGARVDGDVVVVHWSSPLMYQRAGIEVPGGVLYAVVVHA